MRGLRGSLAALNLRIKKHQSCQRQERKRCQQHEADAQTIHAATMRRSGGRGQTLIPPS